MSALWDNDEDLAASLIPVVYLDIAQAITAPLHPDSGDLLQQARATIRETYLADTIDGDAADIARFKQDSQLAAEVVAQTLIAVAMYQNWEEAR